MVYNLKKLFKQVYSLKFKAVYTKLLDYDRLQWLHYDYMCDALFHVSQFIPK